jgi:hypothetical protein
MRYFAVFSALILIWYAYAILCIVGGFGRSVVSMCIFLTIGGFAAAMPVLGRRKSMSALMIAVALYAIFTASVVWIRKPEFR